MALTNSAVLSLIGARLCPQDQSQGLRRVNALRLMLRTQPRSIMRIAVTNWVDICGNGFLIQTRRERRTDSSWVCEEGTTKSESKRRAAHWVVPQ